MDDENPAGGLSALTDVLGVNIAWGDQWLIARQAIVDDLPGRPRLGYTVLAPCDRGATGFFRSCEDAMEALHKESRPLGWVVMQAKQLIAPNA